MKLLHFNNLIYCKKKLETSLLYTLLKLNLPSDRTLLIKILIKKRKGRVRAMPKKDFQGQ